MNALAEVRRLASSRGWRFERETVVVENDYYVNLVLAPQYVNSYGLSETEVRWGPVLMQNNRDPIVRDYFSFHLDKLKRIIAEIPTESTSRSQLQKKIYEERIKELEDVLR
jgi:tRNA A22 N-methylase